MTEQVLLNAADMASRLGYATVGSFMQARRRRGIPTIYIGRSVRFDVAEVDRWLRAQNPRAGRPMPIGARAIAAQPEHPVVVSHADERRTAIEFKPRKRRAAVSVDERMEAAS